LAVIAFLIITIFRAGDLYLTWLITPDLKAELNPIVRLMGWRWSIAVNLLLCALTPFMPNQFLFVGILVSMVAIVWNLVILWRILKNSC